jgi:hypothetical protein
MKKQSYPCEFCIAYINEYWPEILFMNQLFGLGHEQGHRDFEEVINMLDR